MARLREANAAAAREDDEKLALVDKVDARIAAWRDGKTENLRALLGSLDQVLWHDSGWTKVNMADLVVASRVKVVYMKAIAKTHPDKVSGGDREGEGEGWYCEDADNDGCSWHKTRVPRSN